MNIITNIHNPDLQFMKDLDVVYYAGLDPIGPHHLKRKVKYKIGEHVTFLKSLGLALDHIVIPPTFFFPFFPKDGQSTPFLKDLIDLYQTKIISSPVHSGMCSSHDFLVGKEVQGSRQDKIDIKDRKENLTELFVEMPLLHRDVAAQSNRFNHLLESQVYKLRDYDWVQRIFEQASEMEEMQQIKISRDSILDLANKQLSESNISRYQFEKLYQISMSMYYAAGAETYYADISTINSEVFNTLGVDRFASNSQRILVGYDPVVLLNIFKAHGISAKMINSLNVQEMVQFRSTEVFKRFVKIYKEFSLQLQACLSAFKKPTQDIVRKLKTDILIQFCAERAKSYSKKRNISFWHEARLGIYLGLFGGIAGFLINPIIGFLIAITPPLFYMVKAQDKLISYMVDRIASSETVFHDYIEKLKLLTSNLELME